jgi:signal peptidase I
MKYVLIGLINAIYGILLLLTLSSTTPGFAIVLTIGLVLTIIGLIGCVLWLILVIKQKKGQASDDAALKSWFSLAKSFDIVLVIGLFFRALVLQPFIVEGVSMENNFHDGEAMLVDKISYHIHTPKRGDVVIFQAPRSPQDDYIKRVIALPGETIEINAGRVYINGRLLNEPYLPVGTQTLAQSNGAFEKTLAQDEFFVMGDNRANSSDSRDWGILPKKNIIGRAWIVVYPINDSKVVTNYSSTM